MRYEQPGERPITFKKEIGKTDYNDTYSSGKFELASKPKRGLLGTIVGAFLGERNNQDIKMLSNLDEKKYFINSDFTFVKIAVNSGSFEKESHKSLKEKGWQLKKDLDTIDLTFKIFEKIGYKITRNVEGIKKGNIIETPDGYIFKTWRPEMSKIRTYISSSCNKAREERPEELNQALDFYKNGIDFSELAKIRGEYIKEPLASQFREKSLEELSFKDKVDYLITNGRDYEQIPKGDMFYDASRKSWRNMPFGTKKEESTCDLFLATMELRNPSQSFIGKDGKWNFYNIEGKIETDELKEGSFDIYKLK